MVSVGRMIATKEYPDQLKLVKPLCNEDLEVTHTIVGYGKEEKFIRLSIDQLGLNHKVFVVNNASDIKEHYHNADIFIQTSSTEGLPNVVLEAMSCGLCCFATNVGDTGKIIESGINGFLFDIHDIEGMKNQIKEVWSPGDENTFRKICENAKERVAKEFSLQANYQSVLSMYDMVNNHR